MLDLFALPTPSNVLTSIGTWSDPFFTELLKYAVVIAGILIGGMLVVYLYNVIVGAFSKFFGGDEDDWHANGYVKGKSIDFR